MTKATQHSTALTTRHDATPCQVRARRRAPGRPNRRGRDKVRWAEGEERRGGQGQGQGRGALPTSRGHTIQHSPTATATGTLRGRDPENMACVRLGVIIVLEEEARFVSSCLVVCIALCVCVCVCLVNWCSPSDSFARSFLFSCFQPESFWLLGCLLTCGTTCCLQVCTVPEYRRFIHAHDIMHPPLCSVVLYSFFISESHFSRGRTSLYRLPLQYCIRTMYDTIRTFGFGLADPSALRGVRSRSDHSDDLPIIPIVEG